MPEAVDIIDSDSGTVRVAVREAEWCDNFESNGRRTSVEAPRAGQPGPLRPEAAAILALK
jgi:hypothetical protein